MFEFEIRICWDLKEESMGVGRGRDGEVHLQRYWYESRR